jgi:hypothetical protein
LRPDLKVASAIVFTLQRRVGAATFEIIALHLKSSADIDFLRPETVVSNVRVLEDYLQRTFRDSANTLMSEMAEKLLADFAFLPDKNNTTTNNNFSQYSEAGDLSKLVEKIMIGNDPAAILRNAQDKDHFVMSYSRKEEFPDLLVTFLERGFQNNCLDVLLISEEEKRQFESFLISSKRHHHHHDYDYYGKTRIGPDPANNPDVFIVTHAELYGDKRLDSTSSISFQPILDILGRAKKKAAEKQMSGLNVVGTVAGALFDNGQFEECLRIEKKWDETIRDFPMPITLMCLYKKPIEDPHRTPLVMCHSGGIHQLQ